MRSDDLTESPANQGNCNPAVRCAVTDAGFYHFPGFGWCADVARNECAVSARSVCERSEIGLQDVCRGGTGGLRKETVWLKRMTRRLDALF